MTRSSYYFQIVQIIQVTLLFLTSCQGNGGGYEGLEPGLDLIPEVETYYAATDTRPGFQGTYYRFIRGYSDTPSCKEVDEPIDIESQVNITGTSILLKRNSCNVQPESILPSDIKFSRYNLWFIGLHGEIFEWMEADDLSQAPDYTLAWCRWIHPESNLLIDYGFDVMVQKSIEGDLTVRIVRGKKIKEKAYRYIYPKFSVSESFETNSSHISYTHSSGFGFKLVIELDPSRNYSLGLLKTRIGEVDYKFPVTCFVQNLDVTL